MFISWGYLFLFGTPKNISEVFSNIELREGPTDIEPDTSSSAVSLAPNSGVLVQLSTRAVAGFVHIPPPNISATSTVEISELGKIRYVERGTGHIYEIDLELGSETRISGTTVGQTIGAHFNKKGDLVVLTTESSDNVNASLYEIGENSVEVASLPQNSRDFYFTDANTLKYSAPDSTGTIVYEIDLLSIVIKELWRTPLSEIHILWTEGGTFAVNKTAPYLKGGIYVADNGLFQKMVTPEYSLSAFIEPSGNFIFYSSFDSKYGQVIPHILDRTNSLTTVSSLPAIPEKCAFIREREIWCATSASSIAGNREDLNSWYKGTLIYSDTLWKADVTGTSAEYVQDFSALAGFDIDVTGLQMSSDERLLLFINKINGTLWMYKLPQTQSLNPTANEDLLDNSEEVTDGEI